MPEIQVDLGDRSYPIHIGRELVCSTELWDKLPLSPQVMVVTNETIAPLYLQDVMQALPVQYAESYIIPDGESYKNLDVLNNIITRLLELKFSRDCCLVALGGGVVGDITGFAASCYQRGVNYLQIPTTLLAQVDSSVGGKTAVNHELGKNMIGAFYQPVGVISDIDVLSSLPDRELSSGLAEVIKYGLIREPEFFSWLEKNIQGLISRDTECLAYAIERSCINKAEVVNLDEREGGIRGILNLGHTFGHAVETAQNYKLWLHGEAVALGLLMAADLSCRLGWLDQTDVDRIRALLLKARLPVMLPESLPGSELVDLMMIDKKARNGRMYLVLLEQIGQAIVTDEFDHDALKETLVEFTVEPGTD